MMLGKEFEENLSEFEAYVEDVQTKLNAILTQPLECDNEDALDPKSLNARGNMEMQRGNPALAKTWYLRAGSGSAHYLSNLALACLHLQEYTEVVAAADQAIALDPHCWKAYWRKLKAQRQLVQPLAWTATVRAVQAQLRGQPQGMIPIQAEIQEGCAFFLEHTSSMTPAMAWDLPGFTEWLGKCYAEAKFDQVLEYMEARPGRVQLHASYWLPLSVKHLKHFGWDKVLCQIFLFLSIHLPLPTPPWDFLELLIQTTYPPDLIANFLKSKPTEIPEHHYKVWTAYLASHPEVYLLSKVCRIPSLQPLILELLESCSTLPQHHDPAALLLVLELHGPASWIKALLALPPPPPRSNPDPLLWGNLALILSRHATPATAERWGPSLLQTLKCIYFESENGKAASNLAIALAKCSKLSDCVLKLVREEGGLDLLHYMTQKVK